MQPTLRVSIQVDLGELAGFPGEKWVKILRSFKADAVNSFIFSGLQAKNALKSGKLEGGVKLLRRTLCNRDT